MSAPEVDAKGNAIRPLPEIEDAAALAVSEIDPPPVLIDGLLHLGSKMAIGGSSKSFKTWTLLDLAISVATGADWWGHKTMPGRVLYLNLEIDRRHFVPRMRAVLQERGLTLKPGESDVWNLRGHAADLTILRPRMLERVKGKNYALIILDPIYKVLGNRDENKAGDIASLMNELEAMATDSGAAIAFGAHFSKGNQSAKESIDRIGGSGVFARDPDTILVMTRHEQENGYVVESTLRNFPPIQPFCVRWDYPLMRLATELNPLDLKQTNGRGPRRPTDQEFLAMFMPEWPPDKPRYALLSNSELREEFRMRKFDKDSLVACRDAAERKGLIGVVRGLPRNEVLAGYPNAVQEYKRLIVHPEKINGKRKKCAER